MMVVVIGGASEGDSEVCSGGVVVRMVGGFWEVGDFQPKTPKNDFDISRCITWRQGGKPTSPTQFHVIASALGAARTAGRSERQAAKLERAAATAAVSAPPSSLERLRSPSSPSIQCSAAQAAHHRVGAGQCRRIRPNGMGGRTLNGLRLGSARWAGAGLTQPALPAWRITPTVDLRVCHGARTHRNRDKHTTKLACARFDVKRDPEGGSSLDLPLT